AAVRIRARGSLSVAGKIGDESLDDSKLAENALSVINQVEKKLPNGEKNIHSLSVKKTMGKLEKIRMIED
ncbi:MAG: 50S ribosomal protein L1, partial [Nitrososphaerota archaeon]|nr:50S ribosomal protein L1 [Nitrososphaerota archaeon]